jgi:hypothetical protein
MMGGDEYLKPWNPSRALLIGHYQGLGCPVFALYRLLTPFTSK